MKFISNMIYFNNNSIKCLNNPHILALLMYSTVILSFYDIKMLNLYKIYHPIPKNLYYDPH